MFSRLDIIPGRYGQTDRLTSSVLSTELGPIHSIATNWR